MGTVDLCHPFQNICRIIDLEGRKENLSSGTDDYFCA